MGLQIPIRQVVLVTRRALQGVASIWVQVWFPTFSSKQTSVAVSSAKVEYMATNSTCFEAI
jgi:hypothetical protein